MCKNVWSLLLTPEQCLSFVTPLSPYTSTTKILSQSAVVPEHTLPSVLVCVCQLQPLFELRCSNNVVHLHTCADSCAALVNLLQYLVSQGDLHPPPRQISPTEIAGQKLPVRQFSVYVFTQVTLSGCDAEFQLECFQMCDVYFMFLVV